MRTIQCGNCLRYRGDLQCDAYPRGISEDILTGQHDHTKEHAGDDGIRFSPAPDLQKSDPETDVEGAALIEHVNAVVEREDVAYRRIKSVLQNRGYLESDFEEEGPLYGFSTNALIELVRKQRDD